MPRPKGIGGTGLAVKNTGRAKAAVKSQTPGEAGFDNIRENIDPHVRTNVLTTGFINVTGQDPGLGKPLLVFCAADETSDARLVGCVNEIVGREVAYACYVTPGTTLTSSTFLGDFRIVVEEADPNPIKTSFHFRNNQGDVATEAFNIVKNGDVGIGIQGTNHRLHIVKSDAQCDLKVQGAGDTAGQGSLIFLERARGTSSSPDDLLDGDVIGQIVFNGQAGTNAAVATIKCEADGDFSTGDSPARLVWSVSPDGVSNPLPRMTMKNDGATGWDTADPAYHVEIAGSRGSGYFGLTESADGDILSMSSTNTVFNEGGINIDFRIEGLNAVNLFRIDAGEDEVRMGDGTNDVRIEADGDVNFTGGGGLQFGELYINSATKTFNTSLNTYVQLTGAGFWTAGEANGSVVPSAVGNQIAVGKAGRYLISYSVTSNIATGACVEYIIGKNNGIVKYNNSETRPSLQVAGPGGNACKVAANTCIIDFVANDTVELWARRITGAPGPIVVSVQHANFTVTQIGGTT